MPDFVVTDPNGKEFIVTAPSGASQDEVLNYAKSQFGAAQSEPASMTKTAAPATESYDPSFTGTLGREFRGGAADVASGIKEALSLPNRGEVNPMSGIIQALLGTARAVTSPITAAGAFAGEQTGERVRAVAQDEFGLSPDASAAIGTAVGAPINAATQLYSIPKAVGKAAPYAMRGLQAMARALPGAQVTLREVGKKIIEAMPSVLKPEIPSTEIYAQVKQLNPIVTLTNFSKVAQRIASKESALKQYGVANTGLESVASKLAESTAASEVHNLPKELPFRDVQAIRQRIGERIGELRAKSGEGLGAYKQLFKALSQELETTADAGAMAANSPAARTAFKKLQEANSAASREFAIGELDDIFNNSIGRALEGQSFDSTNFAKALNQIRDLRRTDPLFEKGMGAANLDRIEARLNEFRKLKVNPPPKGANVGSALVAARVGAGSGLGFAIGNLIGGQHMGAILGGSGAAAATILPPVVSRIMQSEKGSKALLSLLKREGTISPQHIAAALALVKGEEAVRNDLAGQIKDALKTPDIPIEEKIKAAMHGDQVFKQVSEAEFFMRQ